MSAPTPRVPQRNRRSNERMLEQRRNPTTYIPRYSHVPGTKEPRLPTNGRSGNNLLQRFADLIIASSTNRNRGQILTVGLLNIEIWNYVYGVVAERWVTLMPITNQSNESDVIRSLADWSIQIQPRAVAIWKIEMFASDKLKTIEIVQLVQAKLAN